MTLVFLRRRILRSPHSRSFIYLWYLFFTYGPIVWLLLMIWMLSIIFYATISSSPTDIDNDTPLSSVRRTFHQYLVQPTPPKDMNEQSILTNSFQSRYESKLRTLQRTTLLFSIAILAIITRYIHILSPNLLIYRESSSMISISFGYFLICPTDSDVSYFH